MNEGILGSYEFRKALISGRMEEILRGLAEEWPDEVELSDCIIVECSSERAVQIVRVLAGEQDRPRGETTEAIYSPLVHDPPAPEEIETTDMSTVAAAPELRACEVCGERFIPARSDSKFCSNPCRQKFYNAKYREQKQEKEKSSAAPAVIFDQERETQRMVNGVRSGKMELRGRKL